MAETSSSTPAEPGPSTASDESLRILWFLLHGGYVRFFASPIRLLAARGHHVHLAFSRIEKDAGDRLALERFASEVPNLTYDVAPTRARWDVWRSPAWLSRAFADLARYMHPRFDAAPALRNRVARKLKGAVRAENRDLDPFTRWTVDTTVDALSKRTGARLSDRLIRFFTAIDSAIPTSRVVDRYVADRQPDCVLVSPLVDIASSQVDYPRSAMKLGIPTGVPVPSWDNLSSKGLLRIVPDRLFVWNAIQVQEGLEMHGIPVERTVMTGAPKFDEWFEKTPSTTREAFCRKAGIEPGQPFLLYLCSSWFIAPDEVPWVRRWIEAVRTSPHPSVRDVGIVIRPHPQNARQWDGIDLTPYENVSVWPPGGAQPDQADTRADYFDSLAHSSAVVGVNTSALIEAAIAGNQVFTVLLPEFNQGSTIHFHYLLAENGGFLHMALSLDEHVGQLQDALTADTSDASARTRAFIEAFTRPPLEFESATEALVGAVESLAHSTPEPQHTPRVTGALARAAVFVVGAVAWLALFARAVYRRAVPRRPASPAAS
jgi:hypothetical protein